MTTSFYWHLFYNKSQSDDGLTVKCAMHRFLNVKSVGLIHCGILKKMEKKTLYKCHGSEEVTNDHAFSLIYMFYVFTTMILYILMTDEKWKLGLPLENNLM